MRLYFFIHYSNTNNNSYNHIICFSNKLKSVKGFIPIVVLNSDSLLFFIKHNILHMSRRIFLALGSILPRNTVLHFWTPRKYLLEYLDLFQSKSKTVIHLEDNYRFLREKSSNNCLSHKSSLCLINKFEYVTILNKRLRVLYSTSVRQCFLLRAPTIHKKLTTGSVKSAILHLGTINQYNFCQIYEFINLYQTEDLKFALVGKNFFPEIFKSLPLCDDYGFVGEKKLLDILSTALISFVPYLNPEFDHYRYPSKVPDLLAVGIPTLLPSYDYYQDIFNNFPEFRYEKSKHGSNQLDLAVFMSRAKCDKYRNEISQFAKEYFADDSSFLKFLNSTN
jgi:hypothetical protein